jgi:hypothetical protein
MKSPNGRNVDKHTDDKHTYQYGSDLMQSPILSASAVADISQRPVKAGQT